MVTCSMTSRDPQKVKVVTQIYLESNNFLRLGDRGLVSMEHQ